MAQLYQIDLSGGSASPFRVFSGIGDLVFDANYAALRVYGLFNVDLGISLNPAYPPSPQMSTTAWTYTPFGKTFSRAPLFTPLVKAIGASIWDVPTSGYATTGTDPVTGQFATSTMDRIYFGNYSWTTGVRFSVCVYENGTYG